MKNVRKPICLLLALLLVASLLPAVWAAELPFQDVAPGSWYETYVDYAYSNGLMNGTGEGLFSPDTNMSRGMIVTVLHRLEGSPAASAALPFDDVPGNQYYYAPVVWSYENGIVNGVSDTKFAPNDNVTREQLVTIFYRYANTKGYDTSAQADLSGFSDAAAIQSYAAGALRWAVAEGIITGMTETTLVPGGYATRAQFAAIVQRFNAWAEKQTTAPEPSETVPTEPAPTETVPTEPAPTETSPAEPVQVAAPADYSYMAQLPDNPVQDIRYFTNHEITSKRKPSGTTCEYKSLDDEYIEAYVAMLQENGFTLVEAYSDSFMNGNKYLSWGLTYDLSPELETMRQQFADGQCHLCIWKSKSSSGWTYRIDHVEGLNLCDMGLRMDGTTADLTPQGPSVNAGLLRLPDGSYQTDDGRLTAAVGSAVVVRDGEGIHAKAEFEEDGGAYQFTVYDYQLEESITFSMSPELLEIGAVYRNYEMESDDISFSATVDGENYTLDHNSSRYQAVSLRVMYYEPDGDAVFYIYAKTAGTPGELEALCAVSTSPKEEIPMPEIDESKLVRVDGYGDETATITTDQFLEIFYGNREWDSMYHTFDWEVTEGNDILQMYEGYDSALFIPTGTGVAIIKMVYGYTKEEADVLTGIIRDRAHSFTYTYSIIIEEP